nr:autotransporter-associated beta strand repeat-containing protein [Pirellulales bacterium]
AWNNVAGDTAIFGGTAGTVTLGEAISAAGLQFDTAGYTITANTLTLTGTPAITTDTGVTATIASTLAGTDGLLKNGDGTLTVSTRATYTGATTVTAGTLTLATPNFGRALATSDITVASGATLDVNGTNILHTVSSSSYIPITLDGGLLQLITGSGGHNHFGPLTLNGGTISGKVTSPFDSEYSTFDSDVSVGGTAQSTIQGDSSAYGYNLTSNTRTFTVADTGDASGVDLLISSRLVNGGLVKAGDGTMSLTAANTYNGPTSVTGGTLRISSQMRNTSGMTASNSGTLELGSTNMLVGGHGVAVADSRLLTADGGTLLMNASMDSRIGNVTLTNGGTWTSNRGVAAYDILLANTTAGPATVTVSGTGASTMNGSGGIHLQGV